MSSTKQRWLGALVGALALLGSARPAVAWNGAGHMQIALLAYDALPESQRARLASLVEQHPRFRDDFLPALPASITAPAERARWLFAFASTWPDVARGQPLFEHGTWHYVNLPLELHGSELTSCRQARRELPASQRRIAAIDAQRRARGEPGIPGGDSIREALPNNLRTLADPQAQRQARALALSWVLHLVGDAHQPLHAVALFTERRFVSGDRGGNDILLRERGSLHRVWDGLLGDDASPAALEGALAELRRDRARWRAAEVMAKATTPDTWLDEDCELARRAVYVPAVLAAVARFERDDRPGRAPEASTSDRAPPTKPELSLSTAYHQHAADKARERAVQAGLRLAALLAAIPP
ncbi:MAG TPA: S1/P1 nuclease [Polyangiaceae bacterium]|nr:S1/P1 nuclease [Polyangiaceae bacterium]